MKLDTFNKLLNKFTLANSHIRHSAEWISQYHQHLIYNYIYNSNMFCDASRVALLLTVFGIVRSNISIDVTAAGLDRIESEDDRLDIYSGNE